MKKEEQQFILNTGTIGYPMLFVLLIWIVFWFEVRFNFDLRSFGISPRTIEGLPGVLFSPFIHGDISHLWHNTLPLLILSVALFYFYQSNAWRVLLLGLLFTGFVTWLLGRPAIHIGASGVVYMLFGFLFFKGILVKHFRLIALSLAVIFLYGSMVWYIFPIDPKISWEGHLGGLAVGVVLAFLIRKGIATPNKYYWESPGYNEEEDEFLKHFDEDGNFIAFLPEEEDVTEENQVQVIYTYKEDSSNSYSEEE